MRFVALVALATVLFGYPLQAADMLPAAPPVAAQTYVPPPGESLAQSYVAPPPPPANLIWYVGVGGNTVHHTGYVPGASERGAEKWVIGGKVFGGAKVVEWAKVEFAYFYLNQAHFISDGFTTPSSEKSHAIAGSVIICCVWVNQWVGSPWKTGLFGRFGGAYKFINYQSPVATYNEGGFSYVLGFGAEIDVTSWAFVRVEYEYISKIIGGTKNAVDVQHTPISLALGMRF